MTFLLSQLLLALRWSPAYLNNLLPPSVTLYCHFSPGVTLQN